MGGYKAEITSSIVCSLFSGIMALCFLTIVYLLTVSGTVVVQKSEAGIITNITTVIVDVLEALAELGVDVSKNIIAELLHPPANRNSSIQYLLYTPTTPNKTCYLEPNVKALEECPFNFSYPMKFLIHGFLEDLSNTSVFWQIKDRMLELYDYNVVVVNWTDYNQLPYLLASFSTTIVGRELAELVQFLQSNTGIEAEDIHLIGYSLGAHVAGAAGRHISNLSRITGLDPAAPLFYPIPFLPGLTFEDANFVDVIHTSNLTSGYGIDIPIGNMDFYPNGGTHQPQCQTLGANYTGPESLYTGSCNHAASVEYFLESVNTTECIFPSTMCNDFKDFLAGLCSNDSSPMAEMGLPAEPIVGLQPKSKFYLKTNVYKPYCDEDGYEPS